MNDEAALRQTFSISRVMEIWFLILEIARDEWKELLLFVMAVRRRRNKRWREGKVSDLREIR